MKTSGNRGLPLHYLACFVAVAPFVTTHVSYLLAASLGHLEWCFPYGESCYSISATGRQLPEKLWFKFGMIPSALAAMLLWWSAAAWFRQLIGSALKNTLRFMPITGTIAALFLMLYTVALGEEGEAYRLTRRIGIIFSFALTFISQLLLTRLLLHLSGKPKFAFLARWCKRLMWILVLLLATGVLSVVLGYAMGDNYYKVENGFEWSLALMMNAFFLLLALMWRKANIRIAVLASG